MARLGNSKRKSTFWELNTSIQLFLLHPIYVFSKNWTCHVLSFAQGKLLSGHCKDRSFSFGLRPLTWSRPEHISQRFHQKLPSERTRSRSGHAHWLVLLSQGLKWSGLRRSFLNSTQHSSSKSPNKRSRLLPRNHDCGCVGVWPCRNQLASEPLGRQLA